MRIFLLLGLTLVSLLTTATSEAASLEVYGKKYYNNCSYFSSIIGETVIIYNNPDIDKPGVRVYLHYGLNGHSASTGQILEWQKIEDIEMTPMSNSLWNLKLHLTLHSRSESTYFDGISFVFMIVYPDGSTSFDNGGNGKMSYYQVNWPDVGIGCASPTEATTIPMAPMGIKTFYKN